MCKCSKKNIKKNCNKHVQINAATSSKKLQSPVNHKRTVKISQIACNIPESFMLKNVHHPVVNDTNNLQTQKSPEIVVEIPVEGGKKPPLVLRALLDSGSTGCIILNEFTKGLSKKFDKTEKWMTKGGTFTTKGNARYL